MSKPLVIQTEHLDDHAAAWLGERVELVRCSSDDASFAPLLKRAEGLVIRTYTNVDDAMLAGAPMLKVVGRAGVGLDNVDVGACRKRKVQVVSTPDANTRAVVEYAWALILDAVRPRHFLENAVPSARWKDLRQELRGKRQLCEMTLGIYGFGRIGSAMARVAQAMNMPTIYHDLREIPEKHRSGARPVSREELLAEADVITVHVDGRRSNRDLIDADGFGRMKNTVIFLNTSRGFVVEAASLAEFMGAHGAARAILDVHEPEPFDGDYPLLNHPNIHLAPHIASATELAQRNMSWVVRDVWAVLNGQQPEHPAEPDPE